MINNMKKHRYNIFYGNDEVKQVFAINFSEATILALNFAYQKGWDIKIDKIADEQDNVINNPHVMWDDIDTDFNMINDTKKTSENNIIYLAKIVMVDKESGHNNIEYELVRAYDENDAKDKVIRLYEDKYMSVINTYITIKNVQ